MKKLKLLNILLVGSIALTYMGCSSTDDEETKVNNVSGNVIDGPIYNAKVCVDYNFNQICDDDEPSSITDINGKYSLSNVDDTKHAPLIVIPQNNTIDTTTNTPFTKMLSAPLDGETVNINPVTTLVGAKIYKLYQDNNLTSEAINQTKQEVANFIGVDVNELTSMDITKNPNIYAKSVALSKALSTDLNSINIDLDKLNEGVSAINDSTIQGVFGVLNDTNITTTDINTLQSIVETSISENNISLLETPDEWAQVTLKEFITNNIFFKSNDDGLSIEFNNDNSFISYEEENDSVIEKTGTWSIDGDDSIILTYDSNDTVKLTSFEKVSSYIYRVNGIYNNTESFTDTTLALPKDKKLSDLAGITPFSSADFINKSITTPNKTLKLYDNFSYEEYDKNNTLSSTGKWTVTNGVLELNNTDNNITDDIVKFDNNYFILEHVDNLLKGYIADNNEISINNLDINNVESTDTEEISDANVTAFKNSLDFTPVAISTSTFAGKKIIHTDNKFSIYFMSDGTYYGSEMNGDYKVIDDVLVMYDIEGETIYIAFKNLTSTSTDTVIKSDDGYHNVSFDIDSFDEASFNPDISYVNNGVKIVEENYHNIFMNLNDNGNIQFNIKDEDGTGVQCTTNYTNLEDFNNAFVNNKLTLSADNNEISCIYEVNHDGSVSTQTEEIEITNNNDFTYKVNMISGYFSGDDYNITSISADLIGIDGDALITAVDFIAGKVDFYDENGTKVDVPENAKIRITPAIYQVDGDWIGINCFINSDGTFGDRCYMDTEDGVSVTDMQNALENNTSQIVVYDDENHNMHWDSEENIKYYDENDVNITDLTNIDLNATVSE